MGSTELCARLVAPPQAWKAADNQAPHSTHWLIADENTHGTQHYGLLLFLSNKGLLVMLHSETPIITENVSRKRP